jgi:phosphoglycerate dehydrogenase-like enzyme
VKRTPTDSEWVDECYAPSDLDRLLPKSDYVVLAIPLTPETDKMIGEKELRAMKKTAYLINIARSGVVDEKALIKALQDKEIAGAGLDAVDYSAINISWGVLCNLIPPFLVIRKLSAQVHIAN